MNYIGELHEFAQKRGWSVQFQLVQTDGLDHIKTFTMRAVIDNKIYPNGVGNSKKEAKKNAAKNALGALQNHEPQNHEPVNTESNFSSSASLLPITQPNYTCWLNEHSHRTKLEVCAQETTKRNLGSNIQMCLYVCKYVCGDKEFPEATGNSKKEAKEAAAKHVYECLREQEKQQVLDENGNGEENRNIPDLSTSLCHLKLSTHADTENTTPDKNFIGLLNEYCQKNEQVFDFKAVERRGPAHVPEFVYKVIINQKDYPEGRGRTLKEAKQKAAQLAWTKLKDSDFSSQVSSPSMMSESTDDVSSSQKVSTEQSKSESVVFKNSSSVPEPQPSNVKPKRQLAANFQNSPVSKKDQPNMNMEKQSPKSTPVLNPPPKSRFLDDFDSINKIGKGGFGRVFKARRKLENKVFAVKIVKYTSKACREVSTLSGLVHDNIVRYHTAWTEETAYRDEASDTFSSSSSGNGSEFLYIQMEFCEGKTLCQWIEERNDHPEKYPERRKEAGDIIKQILQAVKYIHSKKLIHRDLKPANIMFGLENRVKVGDFGLVTTEEEDDDGNLLKRTKRAGTRSYMSPEQRQQQSYDRKVDIYAVGLIYFELLWCFGTQTERQKLWEGIRSKKFPEGFSEQFDFEHKRIEQMLCENPEKRPNTKDLLKQLEQHSATTAATEHNVHKDNRTY